MFGVEMSTADLLLKVMLVSTFAFAKSSDSDAVVSWAVEGGFWS